MHGAARDTWRTAGLCALAMSAFAANSLLCRAALGAGRIDAASFTLVRLVSGAAVLAVLAQPRHRRPWRGGDWGAALLLLAYAAPFSFAYLRLGAGVGALVLFGAVQATMIGADLRSGVRPDRRQWIGLGLALGGLGTLTVPGALAPDPIGLLAMAAAGVAWGGYSLRGRRGGDPLLATAGNFARSLLPALPLVAIAIRGGEVTGAGLWLAVASGAVASGLGYAVWYAVVPRLGATRAAVVQLSVPVLAAMGGVLLLGEAATVRLLVASVLVLSGVGLAIAAKRRAG